MGRTCSITQGIVRPVVVKVSSPSNICLALAGLAFKIGELALRKTISKIRPLKRDLP